MKIRGVLVIGLVMGALLANPALAQTGHQTPMPCKQRGGILYGMALMRDKGYKAGEIAKLYTPFFQPSEAAEEMVTAAFLACMSSEPFGQVRERIKRESGPSELKLRLPPAGAAAVLAR
jgi:hypothetical protein